MYLIETWEVVRGKDLDWQFCLLLCFWTFGQFDRGLDLGESMPERLAGKYLSDHGK